MRFLLGFLLLPMFPGMGVSFGQGLGGHVISGFVREEGSSMPLEAAKLEMLSSAGQVRPSVTSDTNGAFSFQGASDGEYSVVATKTGYDPVTVKVTVMRSGTMPVTIALRRTAPSKLLGLGGPVSAHALVIPERARAAYEKGRRLLEDENKPAESIAAFQSAVDAFPSYYEAYLKLGVANHRLGKFPEVEQSLKRAIATRSNKYLEPLYLLADLYNGQQRYAEAEPLARQAVELDNSAWNAQFELARAFVGLKRGADAEASALKCLELKPDNASAYLVLANAHMQEQKYSDVMRDFDGYLKLEPNGPMSENIRKRRSRLEDELQPASGNLEKNDPGPH